MTFDRVYRGVSRAQLSADAFEKLMEDTYQPRLLLGDLGKTVDILSPNRYALADVKTLDDSVAQPLKVCLFKDNVRSAVYCDLEFGNSGFIATARVDMLPGVVFCVYASQLRIVAVNENALPQSTKVGAFVTLGDGSPPTHPTLREIGLVGAGLAPLASVDLGLPMPTFVSRFKIVTSDVTIDSYEVEALNAIGAPLYSGAYVAAGDECPWINNSIDVAGVRVTNTGPANITTVLCLYEIKLS